MADNKTIPCNSCGAELHAGDIVEDTCAVCGNEAYNTIVVRKVEINKPDVNTETF